MTSAHDRAEDLISAIIQAVLREPEHNWRHAIRQELGKAVREATEVRRIQMHMLMRDGLGGRKLQ